MGAYGAVDKRTLYVHHNHSCDIVTFYDEKGNYILSVEDTMDNNLLDAIKRLYQPYVDFYDDKYVEGVERMTPEESKIIGH
jgi:hypothetical protein